MRILAIIVLLFSSVTKADEIFNCDDLIGAWYSTQFDWTLEANRVSVTTFDKNGTFDITFKYEGNSQEKNNQNESGLYKCDGEFVTLTTQKVDGSRSNYIDTYKLLVLTNSYRKYIVVNNDCSNIIGDCSTDKIYESTKM